LLTLRLKSERKLTGKIIISSGLGTCPPDDATVGVVVAEVSVALEASTALELEASAVVAAKDTATPSLLWFKAKQGSTL